MIGTYRHQSLANRDKTAALLRLSPEFRGALGGLCSITRREILNGDELVRWRVMPRGSLGFETDLSARQLKSAQNMTFAAVSSWRENLAGRVRELITGSNLPSDRKSVLYRINARHAWWAKSLRLPWMVGEDGGLAYCTEAEAASAEKAVLAGKAGGEVTVANRLAVSAEDLALARALAKNAQKRCRFPDLRRVNTLVLDSIVAKASEAEKATSGGRIGWWVKAATLSKGHPVNIPLEVNPHFERKRPGAELEGAVQLHLVRGSHGQPEGVAMSLVARTPDVPARTSGTELGIDFGCRHAIFATSEGQLLGRRMLARLAELDAILTDRTASLQAVRTSLESDPYYRQLQVRIRGYVTNEIGRLLNRIAARDGENAVKALVVERLDFRGGGLSRQMNRLVTRTGRGVLKTRLASITAKHGLAVHEVPSPYTSQECSGWGFTTKLNRNGVKFLCRFCGLKLHADVNAARVIRSRRSRPTPDHKGPRTRADTFRLLDRRHRERWNLPAGEAVPGIAGAQGQPAPQGRLRGRTWSSMFLPTVCSRP